MFNSLAGRKLGQYDVLELLNQGGMGTVYKGFQESVGRVVAIKVLPPHPGMDAQYAQRFQLEARSIGALQHPHILPVYDSGNQDDILYLVMAFADGGSLADLVTDAPLSLALVDRLLREIASALDYAHRKGVVHRDIKPANILLDDDGNALLADFGIVKLLADGTNLTGTAIVGTPAYMSPEQGQGKPVDGRADIYALGAMVYEMLTGRQPYAGETPMMIILKHIQNAVPDILEDNPTLPLPLVGVMQTVLAKNPDHRYQTAMAFSDAFSAAILSHDLPTARYPRSTTQISPLPKDTPDATIQFHQPTPTMPIPADTPAAPASADRTLLAGGIIPVVLLVVFVLIAFIAGNNPPPVADPRTTPTSFLADATTAPTQAVAAEENFGELRFNTINHLGDTLTLRVTGLKPTENDAKYAAWLVNTRSGATLALGELIKDAFGDGTLLFTDSEGRMLPATYNAFVITQESIIGDAPAGDTSYSGSVPLPVTAALRAIFVTSEQGLDNGSLLDGTLVEAGFAQQHSGLAAKATNVGGMQVHAEHTINILTGAKEDLNNNGRGENPGRGVGLYAFLDRIDAALDAASSDPTTSRDVQSNAELIRVCTQNVRQWADQAQALERELLAATTVEAVAQQATASTVLTTQIVEGVDANENGQIEAFEGECGLAQIPEYGIQFGNIMVQEGSPNAE